MTQHSACLLGATLFLVSATQYMVLQCTGPAHLKASQEPQILCLQLVGGLLTNPHSCVPCRAEGMHGPEKQPPQQPQSHRGHSVHSSPMANPASEERAPDGSPSMDLAPPLHSAPPFFTPPGPLPLGPSQPLSRPPDSSQYFHHPQAGGHSEPYSQDAGPPQQGQPPSAYHSHASHPPPEPYTPSYTHPQYHAAAQVSAEHHSNQQQQQQQQPSKSRAQFLTQLAHEHGPRRSTGRRLGAGQNGAAPACRSIAEYNSGGQSGASEEKALSPVRKKKKGDEAHRGSDVPSIPLR